MKFFSLDALSEVVASIIFELLAEWLGNVLWKALGLENISLLTMLPPIIAGLLAVGYWSNRNERGVKRRPFDNDVVKLSAMNNLTQAGILSLIPFFFFWCDDKSLVTQSVNVLASFAPLALGVYRTERMFQMVARLYKVSHYFLDKLSKSKYQVKIRERWLYKFLREHDAAREINDIALKQFVSYKMHLWANERGNVKLVQGKDGMIAVVQP